ncbi:MAG TPA: serine hydrolase [Candidatus Saccharimonadales bacterium]|nr:serine hydrolase [Candidatus Saccharimonadales bacterium]
MPTRQDGAKQTAHTRVVLLGAKWLGDSYRLYLPKRKTHRRLLLAVCFVFGLIIAAQLAYPADRALPFATVNGIDVAYAPHDKLAKVITDQFAASKITLTVGGDKSVTYPLGVMGAVPNTEDMVGQLQGYPLWQRLIPGSILWQPVHVTQADVYYDKVPFAAFAAARSKDLSFPPQNARLAIKGGKLTATAELAGSAVDAGALQKAISTAQLQLGKTTTLSVPTKRTPPSRTLQDLAKVRAQAEVVLKRKVAIKADTQQFAPSDSEVASWILLKTAPSGDVTLAVDSAKVEAYLATINKKVGVPAGQTNIDLVDGRESGRTTGATGRAIDSASLVKQIREQLLVGADSITLNATFVDVLPSVIYNHRYTATQAGLQAYVTDTANSRNMHIVVQQLEGQKWYAAAREHESIPSGSTYKLFVAKMLFDRIDKGQIHWNDPMLDTDVAECFDRMTVASTNPCAEAWIAQFGRQNINNTIYSLGFSTGTTFMAPDATHTTAADLNKFMIGLDNGTLIRPGANRDRLLYNLSRHPYKYGIATGSVAASDKVYDKVGFLWDYIHDTAIVMHPKGKYLLTIMTKGQSYAAIASVTREIERIMYP